MGVNYTATQQDLYDLKSSALGLVLEQLGLASPTRFTFVLRDDSDPNNPTIIMRNFDPVTLAPSAYVNGVLYTNNIYIEAYSPGQITPYQTYPVDPEQQSSWYSAVADYTFGNCQIGLGFGQFYNGLTRDDVGGLFYLYSTNNFALESLIPGVHGAGTNASNYVNTAIRPGVGKITFQRLTNDPCRGGFVPMTICYQDSYLTNNTIQHQILEREISQPDILFTAKSLGFNHYSRTDTSHWVNNGAPLQNGPGVIQPPVAINFDRLGSIGSPIDSAYSGPQDFYFPPNAWASFDSAAQTLQSCIPLIRPTIIPPWCTSDCMDLLTPAPPRHLTPHGC